MAKIWSKEEEDLLRELTLQGKSRKDMADIFNVTVSSIQNKVRRLQLTKKPNENIRFFQKIDTEEKAYWLGFLYADGYVVYNTEQSNYELGIELSSVDIEHLEKFNSIFNNKFKISTRDRLLKSGNKNKMSCIRLYSKDLVEDLINNQIVPNKTHSNIFPKIDCENLFFHFLRGYIDGDGSYIIKKAKTSKRIIEYPRIYIAGNNKDCFKYIINKLSKYNINGIVTRDGDNFKLQINQKESCKELIKRLYLDCHICLNRKAIKSQELLNL